MKETKNEANVEIVEKKDNFVKRTGKKVGGFFKKAWPWLLGTTLVGTGVFAYILLRDDEDKDDYPLDEPNNEAPFAAE